MLIVNNRNINVTKNNNHILRLQKIIETGKFKIFITFRNPLVQSASLEKLDSIHSSLHTRDSFALDYMNYLGHYEFGMNKKYFKFKNARVNVLDYVGNDFWLAHWINCYDYLILLAKKYKTINLIHFDDWCSKDKIVIKKLS